MYRLEWPLGFHANRLMSSPVGHDYLHLLNFSLLKKKMCSPLERSLWLAGSSMFLWQPTEREGSKFSVLWELNAALWRGFVKTSLNLSLASLVIVETSVVEGLEFLDGRWSRTNKISFCWAVFGHIEKKPLLSCTGGGRRKKEPPLLFELVGSQCFGSKTILKGDFLMKFCVWHSHIALGHFRPSSPAFAKVNSNFPRRTAFPGQNQQ